MTTNHSSLIAGTLDLDPVSNCYSETPTQLMTLRIEGGRNKKDVQKMKK
jgi:hypothetical protein